MPYTDDSVSCGVRGLLVSRGEWEGEACGRSRVSFAGWVCPPVLSSRTARSGVSWSRRHQHSLQLDEAGESAAAGVLAV